MDDVDGGPGNDTIYGYGSDDIMWGDDGNDYLSGGSGNEVRIDGGLGDDTIDGNDGDDLIYDPLGNNTVELRNRRRHLLHRHRGALQRLGGLRALPAGEPGRRRPPVPVRRPRRRTTWGARRLIVPTISASTAWARSFSIWQVPAAS